MCVSDHSCAPDWLPIGMLNTMATGADPPSLEVKGQTGSLGKTVTLNIGDIRQSREGRREWELRKEGERERGQCAAVLSAGRHTSQL